MSDFYKSCSIKQIIFNNYATNLKIISQPGSDTGGAGEHSPPPDRYNVGRSPP